MIDYTAVLLLLLKIILFINHYTTTIKFFFSGIDADFGLREEEEELSEELFREECSLFFSDAL